MSTKTANYNMTLPAQDEYYNVDIFNDNYEIIDGELKRLDNSINGLSAVASSGSYNDLSDKPNTGRGATVYTINADTFSAGLTMNTKPYVEILSCSGRIVYIGLLKHTQKSTAQSCGLSLYDGSASQGAIGIQVDDTALLTSDIQLVVVDLGAFGGTEAGSVIINGL